MIAQELIDHLDTSIAAAERLESRLATNGDPLMEVGGFCGLKTRHLWNNLGSRPGIRYLEIGVLHGATLLSFCYGNQVHAVGVDNFSQFYGDAQAVLRNIDKFLGESRCLLHVGDCWEADLSAHAPFDVLFYDGGHSQEETARAFSHFLPVMAENFLMLVDDFNWRDVSAGVWDGVCAINLKPAASHLLGAGNEGSASDYWNGCWAGVFTK